MDCLSMYGDRKEPLAKLLKPHFEQKFSLNLWFIRDRPEIFCYELKFKSFYDSTLRGSLDAMTTVQKLHAMYSNNYYYGK
jgi:hypothetical protein